MSYGLKSKLLLTLIDRLYIYIYVYGGDKESRSRVGTPTILVLSLRSLDHGTCVSFSSKIRLVFPFVLLSTGKPLPAAFSRSFARRAAGKVLYLSGAEVVNLLKLDMFSDSVSDLCNCYIYMKTNIHVKLVNLFSASVMFLDFGRIKQEGLGCVSASMPRRMRHPGVPSEGIPKPWREKKILGAENI